MMRRDVLSLLGGIFVGLTPGVLHAHGYKTRTIEINHPWTYEQEGKGVDAVVGMDIRNKGKRKDSLIRVETPDAIAADIIVAGAVVPTLEIAPGAELTLHQKGPHIRLKGVRKTLFPYNVVNITLVFARAGKISVEVLVEDRPA